MTEVFELAGADNLPIYGDVTFDSAKKPVKTIVFIHGFKGFKDWGAYPLVARYFAEMGFVFLKFNLSHSGADREVPGDVTHLEVFAQNTFTREQFDIDAVLAYATAAFPGNSLILMGHSRGGGLAILQAAKDKRVHQLITLSAVDDFKNLWRNNAIAEWKKNGRIFLENARTKVKMPLDLSLLEDYEQNKTRLDIHAAAAQVNIPWLIVHGTADPSVPFETAINFQETNKTAKLLEIPGADHVYGASHPYTRAQMPPQLFAVCEACVAFINTH